MDHEYGESRECYHDDDVMCNHLFFSWSTRGYLARQRLVKLIND